MRPGAALLGGSETILQQWRSIRDANVATHEEHLALLKVRREVLDQACDEGRLGGSLPVRWRTGYKCTINILGRDADGSLRASVYAQGPKGNILQSRNVRLIRSEPLPWSLRR
jgi:hypothetical protein